MCVDEVVLKIYMYDAVITISAVRHDIYKYNAILCVVWSWNI